MEPGYTWVLTFEVLKAASLSFSLDPWKILMLVCVYGQYGGIIIRTNVWNILTEIDFIPFTLYWELFIFIFLV